MDVQEEGAGVLWNLELDEGNVDEETASIIHEIATCYRIDLEEIETAVAAREKSSFPILCCGSMQRMRR